MFQLLLDLLPPWTVVLLQTLAVSKSSAVTRETVAKRSKWIAARRRRRTVVTRKSAVKRRNVGRCEMLISWPTNGISLAVDIALCTMSLSYKLQIPRIHGT